MAFSRSGECPFQSVTSPMIQDAVGVKDSFISGAITGIGGNHIKKDFTLWAAQNRSRT
ncbi:hypothetical protein BH10PSE6_BH10PSE6_28370 [soil metagenome]